jgi:hypothetical protein
MVPVMHVQKAFICLRYNLRRRKCNGVSSVDIGAATDRPKLVLGNVWAKAAAFTVPAQAGRCGRHRCGDRITDLVRCRENCLVVFLGLSRVS